MSKESIDKLFDSLYRLTDLRGIFRETKPIYDLSEEQEKEVKEIVREVKENLDKIEEDMTE